MQCRVIQSEAELRAIADDWTRLVTRLPAAVPFQLPAWLITWWKHYGSGDLQTLAFYDREQLAAVVPLFRHNWNDRRQLTLIGSGISDWTDPAMEVDVVSGIEEYLAIDSQWDVLDWQDLSADTPLRVLAEVSASADTPCSEIKMQGSFDEYWKARSSELRRNLRRYGERARQAGGVEFHVYSEPKPEVLQQLIRLHGARWQRSGEPGMIASNHADAFLFDVAERFAAGGMLRFFVLCWETKIVAIIMAIVYRDKVFAYMSAFDPEHEVLGFGRALVYESIRYCFGRGYTAWNFLRGAEPYKASWGAEAIPKIRLYRER